MDVESDEWAERGTKMASKSGRSLGAAKRMRRASFLLMAALVLLLPNSQQQPQHTTRTAEAASQQVESASPPPQQQAELSESFLIPNHSRSRQVALKQQKFVEQPPSSSANRARKRWKRRTKLSSGLLPEFSAPIGNVSAVLGRDVRLVCTVEHLGQYQVAWLKEESKTILSIDINIITTNYRIFLIPDEEERKWVLHIKDVQESDRGFYQCQVNTIPMRTSSGYLEVVVPPKIVESQSSQVAETIEHSNVSIQCKAEGHPRPIVSWRRDDGSPIRLNGSKRPSILQADHQQQQESSVGGGGVERSESSLESANVSLTDSPTSVMGSLLDDVKSDKLSLYDVDRSMAGIYACTASNGIPSQATKKIPLYVKFPPKTSVQKRYISVNLGDQLEIDCIIEAFPRANSYWSKKPPLVSSSMSMLPFQEHNHRLGRLVDKHNDINDAGGWSSNSARGALSMQPIKLEDIEEFSLQTSNISKSSQQTRAYNKHSANQAKPQPAPPVFMHHPHNRIQFSRQADHYSRQLTNEMPLINFAARNQLKPVMLNGDEVGSSILDQKDASGSGHLILSNINTDETVLSGQSVQLLSNRKNLPYFTVKPTAINSYTYKLKLIINKMRAEYLGEYICSSTNSMGSSTSSVTVNIVKGSEKIGGQTNLDENEFRRESSISIQQHPQSHQTSVGGGGGRRSSGGGHIVYDENYLQAIKTRQSGISSSAASERLQQKFKKHPDRNGSKDLEKRISLHLLVSCIFVILVIQLQQL